MKQTRIQLFKFFCLNNKCGFEFFINRNNNILLHYNPAMSTVLEWKCPECGENLRYSPNNVRFEYLLEKSEKEENNEQKQ